MNNVSVAVVFSMSTLEERRKIDGLSMKDLSFILTGCRSDFYYNLCLSGGKCNDWNVIQKIAIWYGCTTFLFDYIEPLVKDVLDEILEED